MSVLIVTSVGDIVVDLHTDRCPLTTKNFLKLCKMKYYNGSLFHKVEKDFLAQTGDPTGTGTGGDSIYKYLYGDQARFFEDETHPDLKHSKTGTVAMASAGENCNASQFYFTLRDDLDYLDGKHTVFGIVEEKEGLDILMKISEAFVDDKGRPLKNIRIKHTYILDDPFDDPPQLADFVPEKSPEGKPPNEAMRKMLHLVTNYWPFESRNHHISKISMSSMVAEDRLEDNWVPMDETLSTAELEEIIRAKEAHTNAAILESIGDIPDAEVKPPENVLFVCKLNPVTQDEDLHTIFSRFGNVTSADIIRDNKTGDSLCYAFIEFETNDACEMAFYKMDKTLIDDRRIHVDFSQSVARLWKQFRHGKRDHTNTGGCFKCGAVDHIAKDCDQGLDNKQKGSKYVLKDDDKQRGGDGPQRYDMLFDDDDLDNMKHQDTSKKRKADHEKVEQPMRKDLGKKISDMHEDKHRHGTDGSRANRDDDWNHGDRRGDGHQRDEAYVERCKGRYEDRGHYKRYDSSYLRHRGSEDHRRSSSSSHHERDYRKRGTDGGKSQRDGHYEGKSRDRDNGLHKERRHGDERRK